VLPSDWVVVGGLQQVRLRMEVKQDQRPMPSLGGQGEAAGQSKGDQAKSKKGKGPQPVD
jgi:hypothetical protein